MNIFSEIVDKRRFLILKFLVLIGVSLSIELFADDPIMIKGIVKDQRSGLPITNANIFIPDLNLGTSSNYLGEFNLEYSTIDSILISAIGYEDQIIHLKDSAFKDLIALNISLIPKTYELSEVKIKAYPSYSELKSRILAYEMTTEEINRDALMKAFQRNIAMLSRRSKPLDYMDDSGGFSFGSPVTAIYKLFSRYAKNEKKYNKLLIADDIKKKVEERINFEVVSRLTGLKNKEEVTDFIAYCNFSDTFVLAASEIQLYTSIMERYHEYVLIKSRS